MSWPPVPALTSLPVTILARKSMEMKCLNAKMYTKLYSLWLSCAMYFFFSYKHIFSFLSFRTNGKADLHATTFSYVCHLDWQEYRGHVAIFTCKWQIIRKYCMEVSENNNWIVPLNMRGSPQNLRGILWLCCMFNIVALRLLRNWVFLRNNHPFPVAMVSH